MSYYFDEPGMHVYRVIYNYRFKLAFPRGPIFLMVRLERLTESCPETMRHMLTVPESTAGLFYTEDDA